MVENIPLHCIDVFVKKFGVYPSVCLVKPPYNPENFIDKSIEKYYKLWETKTIESDGKISYSDILLEYDPTGILFYIKGGTDIFILSRIDKLNIVDFTIHNLKKRK